MPVVGWDSSVVRAISYGLDGPGVESQWERDFPHPFRMPWNPPTNKLNEPKNYKQTKYQPTKEEKPIKYKTTNKSQPEPAQVGISKTKLKTK